MTKSLLAATFSAVLALTAVHAPPQARLEDLDYDPDTGWTATR